MYTWVVACSLLKKKETHYKSTYSIHIQTMLYDFYYTVKSFSSDFLYFGEGDVLFQHQKPTIKHIKSFLGKFLWL